MKLLTFLGVGNYQPAEYVRGADTYCTDLFAEALVKWLKPADMFVFLTERASGHANWIRLQERVAAEVRLHPKPIPDGATEEELWRIFTTLTDCLSPQESVLFDITHAFRSLPVLSLLAAVYLRTAKNVNIEGIVYGAYEAKDQANRAPVFDLSPFLGLLDWVTGADHFMGSGDCRELAKLLRQAHRAPWRTAGCGESADLPRHLQNVAASLEKLTQALLLTRPHEAAEHSQAVCNQLDTVAGEARRWAPPFAVLLEQLRQAFSPLADDRLGAQREMIRWYIAHDHRVQAVTLAREWLLSWTCHALAQDPLRDRQEVERAIQAASLRRRGLTSETPPTLLPRIQALSEMETLLDAWQSVADLRNDVAHCGMRIHPRPTKAIAESIDRLPDKLAALPVGEVAARAAPSPRQGTTFLFNSPVLTAFGSWSFDGPLSAHQVQDLLRGGFVSAVGHEATARFLAKLLGADVAVNRATVHMQPGDRAVVFRLKERPPEGKILSAEELRDVPYEFGLLTRAQ